MAQRQAPAIISRVEASGGESGGGLVVQTPSGCGVLTAAHVVDGASDILMVTSTGSRWIGQVRRSDRPADVAMIEVEEQSRLTAASCHRVHSTEEIDLALQSGSAQIFYPNPNGEIRLIPVEVVTIDTEAIRIRPLAPDAIRRGMSGSPIISAGIPVALLNSVDSENGIGQARRLDHASRLMGPRFVVQPEIKSEALDPDRFVEIVTNGRLSDRERTIRAGLRSSDELLRSLAMRYSLCRQGEFVINFSYPQDADSDYTIFQSQTVAFKNQTCDPDIGHAELAGPLDSDFRRIGLVGNMTINGDRVTIVADVPIQANRPSSQCRFSFRLEGTSNLTGSMACSGYWGPFGPTSAIMNFR